MTHSDNQTAFWGQFLHDPCKFVGTFWPHFTLAPYQQNILQSVCKNTETWVHSGNELGKSFIAAMTALWWFATRRSKVVTISTTEEQLKGILWGEIGDLLATAKFNGQKFDFGFVKNELELRYKDEAGLAEPKFYLRGRVAAKVESIQGNHLPWLEDKTTGKKTGTVLFVVEEASGVDDPFFPAIDTQRHHALFIGNPLRDQGVFAKVCKGSKEVPHPTEPSKLLRKVIHVSAKDSPNVQAGERWAAAGKTGSPPEFLPSGKRLLIPGIISYETFKEREATLTPAEKKTRLYGEFPDEEGQKMFPSSWLKIAEQLGAMLAQRMRDRGGKPTGKPFSLGIDPSGGGGDTTAWCVWGRFGLVEILAKETPDTVEVAGTTLALMRKYRIRPWYVCFDAGGGGKQIADHLRANGYEEISDVDFGSRADDPRKYMNKRAELYGELRAAMEPSYSKDGKEIVGRIGRMLKLGSAHWGSHKLWCASIPPDAAILREDLAVLPLLRDAEGRLRILPKDKARGGKTSGRTEKCIRELLGRSPDQGDACALAHYAWVRGREYDAAASIDGPLVWG